MSDCFDHMCEALDGRWDGSDSEPRYYGRNNNVTGHRYPATYYEVAKCEVHAETKKAVLLSGFIQITGSTRIEVPLDERWIPKSMLNPMDLPGSYSIKDWLVQQIYNEQQLKG